jgi:hypothetical protein
MLKECGMEVLSNPSFDFWPLDSVIFMAMKFKFWSS